MGFDYLLQSPCSVLLFYYLVRKCILVLLTYLVTWVNYPSSPSGRDLNLSLKTCSNGELTTASGRLFQVVTTLCEKNFDLMSVRA